MAEAAKVLDPVCGMTVDSAKTPHRAAHDGTDYFFCGKGCREKFVAEPAKYLDRPAVPDLTHTEHSRLIRDGRRLDLPDASRGQKRQAGSLPDLRHGARAVEPVQAAAAPNPELADMTRRFWIASCFTLPVSFWRWPASGCRGCNSCWRSQPYCGRARRSSQRGWASMVNRSLNMFTLIALGTGIAYLDSIVALAVPQHLPAVVPQHARRRADYFEAAAVDHRAGVAGSDARVARPRRKPAPRSVRSRSRAQAGAPHRRGRQRGDVPLEGHAAIACACGQAKRCRWTAWCSTAAAHRRIDADRRAMPVEKAAGDKVTGATINSTGSFVMHAERVGAETLLAQIVALVAKAQRSRAPIQSLADAVAGWFVPVVIAGGHRNLRLLGHSSGRRRLSPSRWSMLWPC